MQCLCGAHWCYYCQAPVNECDGYCRESGEYADDDDDEGYDDEEHYSDEDEDEDERDHEVSINAINPSLRSSTQAARSCSGNQCAGYTCAGGDTDLLTTCAGGY